MRCCRACAHLLRAFREYVLPSANPLEPPGVADGATARSARPLAPRHPISSSALILAALVAIATFCAAAVARGDAPTLPAAPSAVAQEINDPASPGSVCTLGGGTTAARPCLGGAPGACLTREALRLLRDAATKVLPAREEELRARASQVEALGGALAAAKTRTDLLQAALGDVRQALGLERDAATKALDAATQRRSPWLYVALVSVGALAGAGVTVGVVYALRPANPGASAKALGTLGTSGARRAPIVIGLPLFRF